ncbi:Listeria/Bacterioides repeat-containing protein, partial [Peptostreptococcaceae bacterium pGA-8]
MNLSKLSNKIVSLVLAMVLVIVGVYSTGIGKVAYAGELVTDFNIKTPMIEAGKTPKELGVNTGKATDERVEILSIKWYEKSDINKTPLGEDSPFLEGKTYIPTVIVKAKDDNTLEGANFFINGEQAADIDFDADKGELKGNGFEGTSLDKNRIKVTYHNLDEDFTPQYHYVTKGALYAPPFSAFKPGYTFSGWYYDSALQRPVNPEGITAENDIDIFAKFVKTDYTFNLNVHDEEYNNVFEGKLYKKVGSGDWQPLECVANDPGAQIFQSAQINDQIKIELEDGASKIIKSITLNGRIPEELEGNTFYMSGLPSQLVFMDVMVEDKPVEKVTVTFNSHGGSEV